METESWRGAQFTWKKVYDEKTHKRLENLPILRELWKVEMHLQRHNPEQKYSNNDADKERSKTIVDCRRHSVLEREWECRSSEEYWGIGLKVRVE